MGTFCELIRVQHFSAFLLQDSIPNKLCAWRHKMPSPLSPRGRPSASRAAEQTQTSSTLLSHAVAPLSVKAALSKAAWWPWPFDLESGVRVTCDVGYLCANFGLPRPLSSRVTRDVRDRQSSDKSIAKCPAY